MKQFSRYTHDKRPKTLSEDVMRVFDALRAIYDLNRVGVEATATALSRTLGISVYRVRKLVHSLHEIGLTDWTAVKHRRNVTKRLYRLTPKGRDVLIAFQDDLPSVWKSE
jgi:Mn-dependent DtxR family transcriptional regulator